MYKLLGRQTSGNVQKIIFMLEELGTPYEREDYGRQFGNTGTAEYLAMNPAGKVPRFGTCIASAIQMLNLRRPTLQQGTCRFHLCRGGPIRRRQPGGALSPLPRPRRPARRCRPARV